VERSSTDSDPTIPNRNATAARTANALPTAGGFDVGEHGERRVLPAHVETAGRAVEATVTASPSRGRTTSPVTTPVMG
jgi:hypothetical protein